MFSLIITIISIALVAALALATLYYGGNAFNQGAARAEASKILNQGQQLVAAADLFIAREGTVPTLQELLDGGYLKSIPQAALALQTANAADTPWTMPVPGQVVFIMPSVDQAVCQEVNADLLGFNGILEEARTQLVSQCYGPEDSYQVVFAKSAPVLRAAADQDLPALPQATVVDTAVPDASDTAAWVVEPGIVVAGSGSGTGGGTTDPDPGDTGGVEGFCADGSPLQTNVILSSAGSGASYVLNVAQTVACSEVGTATIAETLVEDNGVNDAFGTNFRPVNFIELYAGNLQAPANLGIGDYSHYYATDYINQLVSGSTSGGVMNIGANYSDAVANGGFAGPSEAYTAGTRFSLANIPVGTPMTLRFMHGFEQPQAEMNFNANGTGSVQLCVTWGRSGLGSLDTTSVVQGACPAPV